MYPIIVTAGIIDLIVRILILLTPILNGRLIKTKLQKKKNKESYKNVLENLQKV
jgi:hypothetical protein